MEAFSWSLTRIPAAAVVAIVALLAPASVVGQTHNLKLSWTPNPEPDITAYYVHVGTASGSHTLATTQVPSSQTTFAFPATPGVRYYFAVSAVNGAGVSSPKSAEVVGGVPVFTQPSNQGGVVGTLITPLQLGASDPDGGSLRYSATGLPAGLTISTSGLISGTPTTIGSRTVTASVFDGTVTVSRTFTWTISGAPATVTAAAVSPGSGSGSAQTFAVQYTDSLGAADLSTAWVWFSSTFTPTSAGKSCMAYYSRTGNLMYLLNDAGTSWTSASLGSGTLQNSQCAISLGGTSAVASGDTLTLNLPVTFKSTFAGTKNVYLYAASAGGSNSNWHSRGTWTVPAPTTTVTTTSPASVTVDSVSPATGTGTAQTFALKVSDTAGAADIATAWVWFHSSFTPSAASRSCMAYYDRASRKAFLLNDAATSWAPGVVGSTGVLQNSQCAIALASSSAATSGNTLTVNLAVTFKAAFAGTKNVYLYAASARGVNSGWADRGDFTVPATTTAPTVAAVSADSVSPASGFGLTKTFALQYSDSLAATDLATAWVWFNSAFTPSAAGNSCLVHYDRARKLLLLLNDAGNGWISATLPGSSTLQNKQCAISLASSSVTLSGTVMTLNLNITFKTAFIGAKNIYMYGAGSGGANSGWQTRGTWTVQ